MLALGLGFMVRVRVKVRVTVRFSIMDLCESKVWISVTQNGLFKDRIGDKVYARVSEVWGLSLSLLPSHSLD